MNQSLESSKSTFRQQYGSVFTFWMAGLPMVFVTDWKLIKQYFIKDGGSYVGRPEFPLNTEVKSWWFISWND